MNDYNTFFTIIYISKVRNSVRMKERQEDRGRRHRLAEDCYINPFLTHVVITSLFVWREVLNRSLPALPVLTCAGRPLSKLFDYPNLFWLTDRLTGLSCIYNFITPARSSSSWFIDLLPLVNPRKLSSCLHCWNVLPRKSLIDDSVKGQ